jgi:hypothetical protein
LVVIVGDRSTLPTITVLLALPSLLRDIVSATLADRPDVTVCLVLDADDDLSSKLREHRPDCAIVDTDDRPLSDCVTALARSPRTRLIAISHHGRRGHLVTRLPAGEPAAELSRAAILDAVGDGATNRPRPRAGATTTKGDSWDT